MIKDNFFPENQLDDNIWFSILKSDLENITNGFNSVITLYYLIQELNLTLIPLLLKNNHLNYAITWFY